MKLKLLLWLLYTVLALFLVGVVMVSAQGGQAKLVIINFVGGAMTFTLDGTLYVVPGTDTLPDGGQLNLMLTPGRHTYSAHVPGSEGTNGEVELVAGQTQVLGTRLERSEPVVSPVGIVLEEPRDTLVFFEASLTPPAPATAAQPVPLQPLLAGQGALVFVNYIGESLTIDVRGVLYAVPANGRLQVNLPPGEVSYSASTGLSGLNSTAQVRTGMYTGLGFTREISAEEPDYQVGDPVPTPVPLKMSVFPVSLKDEPVGKPTSTPTAGASPTRNDLSVPAPTGLGELSVVNYVGETLTFTIDNQAYSVAGSGGKLTLNLAPGEYTFSASTPRVGVNSSLRIPGGAVVRISIALDAQSGQMKIYSE